jgi:endonuclease YncB( thermonuclease family)
VEGIEIHIADGDTLSNFTSANQLIKIRLAEIDVLEKA